MESEQIAELVRGHDDILKFTFAFADSMALKCAVELRIADIIHSHDQPMTLRQIASSIDSPSPDIASLERVMRLLADRKVFTVEPQPDDGETLYGPSDASRWILHDSDLSLAPLVILINDERLLASWQHLGGRVRDGGDAFEKAHGLNFWEYMSQNPGFSELFNQGMQCNAALSLGLIAELYKDAFDSLEGSMVDVGGGTGAALAAIVEVHPNIKGINFDLPHVIATAPEYPGVTHVGGDMFQSIPSADAIFMKSLLHDWGDENCKKILKNCRKSIPDTGKLILVEMILSTEASDKFDMVKVSDLMMLAHFTAGKERTEQEWKTLLNEGGFKRINIIKTPSPLSIIEAYPF